MARAFRRYISRLQQMPASASIDALSISLMNQCHLDTFTASQNVTEPSRTSHALSVREEAHSQSFPTVYLSIETHVSKYVN